MDVDASPRRRSHPDQQLKAVEKTAMYRNPWELAIYVRHHTAELANEHRTCSAITRSDDGPAILLTQLRHHLGIGLIKVGQTLAGYDAVRGLPASPPRPATWGPGS